MKYCQGNKCHEYRTKDRIRGMKGNKHYQTRRRTHLLFGLFCSQRCEYDWVEKFGDQAIDHFGRVTEPKKVLCDQAWYKDYIYNYDHTNNRSNNTHYLVNDLLGQRIPITEQQFDNNTPEEIRNNIRE
tara:strand:+ start:77 stop:460 length:384 start_codon:yes stop_codon:yes gene_type:complete